MFLSVFSKTLSKNLITKVGYCYKTKMQYLTGNLFNWQQVSNMTGYTVTPAEHSSTIWEQCLFSGRTDIEKEAGYTLD